MAKTQINRSVLAILNALASKLPNGQYTIADNHDFVANAGTFRSVREFLNQCVDVQEQDGVLRGALNLITAGKQRTKIITDDYQSVHDDAQLLVLPTSKDITITLPPIANTPNDAISRTVRVIKLADTYDVVVVPTAGDEYARGMTAYRLVEPGSYAQFITLNSDVPQAKKWFTFPTASQAIEVVNSGSLDGDDYNGAGAQVPFDTVVHSDNTAIMEHNAGGGGTTKLTAKVKGEYSINYWLSFNKSGVGAWSAKAYLHKNGSAQPASELSCNGQGSNSDASISLPLHVIDLNAGDVIELHLIVTGTGTSVVSSGMSMRVNV